MVNEQEYGQVNRKVSLGPLDSKVEPLPVRMFLQVLPNLQPFKGDLDFQASGGLGSFTFIIAMSQGEE